jgi:hypothetical protein
MTEKIVGKFYPLRHDEWVKTCIELGRSDERKTGFGSSTSSLVGITVTFEEMQ